MENMKDMPMTYVRASDFPRISPELLNIFQYYRLIEKISWLDDESKASYWEQYQHDFKSAYHDFNSMNVVLRYIYKKLLKIVSNGMKLMNYYAQKLNLR